MSQFYPYRKIVETKKGDLLVQGSVDGRILFEMMNAESCRMAKAFAMLPTMSRKKSIKKVSRGNMYVNAARTQELKSMLRMWLADNCAPVERKLCARCVTCSDDHKPRCPSCKMCEHCATVVRWQGGTDTKEIITFRVAPEYRQHLVLIMKFLKVKPSDVALALTSTPK